MKTRNRGLPILLITILSSLLLVGGGRANEEVKDEAKGQTESDLADFQSLKDSQEASLQEVAALMADAEDASGADAVALRGRALDLRLEAAKALIEMGNLVEQIRSHEVDVALQIEQVTAQMPSLWTSLRSDYGGQSAARAGLVASRAKATSVEDIAALEREIARHSDTLVELLSVGIDGVELSRQLGIAAQTQKGWLTGQLLARARLAASRLESAFHELNDLSAHADSGADEATLEPAEVAANHRLSIASDNLRAILGLMDRLELDSGQYTQLLIESTGELTVEAIGDHVIRDILFQWLEDVRESVASSGPSHVFAMLVFLLIVGVFFALSRFIRKVVTRAVEARHLGFSELLKRTLISLSSGAVFAIGLLIALSQLGIEIGPMLAGLGIAGFVLGFALQDTLANFAAGLMVLLYRPYDVGDLIDCAGGVFGTVSHMSLVSTTILTIDNKTLIVPNSKIWGDVITNVTAQRTRRVDLEFGIGYSDDIPKAEEIMTAILEEHPKILADPEPVVKLHSLGDSSVNFVVRPWVDTDDYWDVFWDVTREVKLRFDREGVSIPFPQRDVHFYPAEQVATGAPRAETIEEMKISSTPIDSQDEPDSEDS